MAESATQFGGEFAKAIGLSTDKLLSFRVDVEPGLVQVTAKYAAPRGAGEAAAELIKRFDLVKGPVSEEEGEMLNASTGLMSMVETNHCFPVTGEAGQQ